MMDLSQSNVYNTDFDDLGDGLIGKSTLKNLIICLAVQLRV